MLIKGRWRKRKQEQHEAGPGPATAQGGWLTPAAGVELSADVDGPAWFNTTTGQVFVGNRVAALVWRAAMQGLSFEATVEQIATRFRISRERAEQDIRIFVKHLQKQGLVQQEGKHQ